VVHRTLRQPPRRPSAKPEARHVRLLFNCVGVPRFDPRPEGKGAGVQNAGMRASVGRRLQLGGVWSWIAWVPCGLASTKITGLEHWLRAL